MCSKPRIPNCSAIHLVLLRSIRGVAAAAAVGDFDLQGGVVGGDGAVYSFSGMAADRTPPEFTGAGLGRLLTPAEAADNTDKPGPVDSAAQPPPEAPVKDLVLQRAVYLHRALIALGHLVAPPAPNAE